MICSYYNDPKTTKRVKKYFEETPEHDLIKMNQLYFCQNNLLLVNGLNAININALAYFVFHQSLNGDS